MSRNMCWAITRRTRGSLYVEERNGRYQKARKDLFPLNQNSSFPVDPSLGKTDSSSHVLISLRPGSGPSVLPELNPLTPRPLSKPVVIPPPL